MPALMKDGKANKCLTTESILLDIHVLLFQFNINLQGNLTLVEGVLIDWSHIRVQHF